MGKIKVKLNILLFLLWDALKDNSLGPKIVAEAHVFITYVEV